MNRLYELAHVISRFISEEVPPHDSEGIHTHSAWLPEKSELIYGTFASVVIFAALYKFAGPLAKKALAARTERVQKELDGAASDKAAAATEAAEIRQAKGDIGAERDRLLADADVQAATLLAEGRSRLEAEMADLQARAEADIVTASNRGVDELRAEISRLASQAADRAVAESIDGGVHQQLIETFIQKVGASA